MASEVISIPTTKRWRQISSELKRLPWPVIIILGAFIFIAVFSPYIAPLGPFDMTLSHRLQPPGFEEAGKQYLLGTDTLGRDLLTRIIFGARTSLIVAGFGLFFGGGIGLIIGIVSGYIGGMVDSVLMRLTDTFMALPSLLIALVFVMTVGPGLVTVIVALAVVTWARFTRTIRGEVLQLKEQDFVLQAKVAGCSPLRIMVVHILPNVLNTWMVLVSMTVSRNILTEASLSFLGAGIPPPTPTWGNMVADGRNYVSSAWWISVFPGLALALVVFAFNQFGDWLRDRLDPKLRQL